MKFTLTIGIPVHAEPERLQSTLSALGNNTIGEFQIIVLPDGPDPDTVRALESLRDLPQLGTAEPRGDAACFNRLAQASDAEVIMLIESGAIVGPQWLDLSFAALEANPRHGLVGPSTNRSWNEQAAFPTTTDDSEGMALAASEAKRRFGTELRTLDPLFSLADFCYMVRREVIRDVGLADESYGLGPCWEMDYNIRAARAGWRGVWACAAYVHRAPFTARRRTQEARLFEASKHRYQDKFCGAQLRGQKTDFRPHCRGDACPNFAPVDLIRMKEPSASQVAPSPTESTAVADVAVVCETPPLVTCITPTCDRLNFVPHAVRCFLRQDYPSLELVIVDDGAETVAPLLPGDSRVRLIRLLEKKNIGAKRNIACAAARGEFIIHWDDDDWYPPDRVTRQIEALREGHADICGTSTLFYHDARSARAWRYSYKGSGRAWVAGNTLAYRRSCWTAHPFAEIQVGEDSRFVWADPRAKLRDLNDPNLCVARIHANNTSLKVLTGTCWQPCAVVQIESLLGHEWSAFVSASRESRLWTKFPVVSCIMPTFNRRHFLPLALKAFDSQDYPAKELIVVDDGTQPVGDLVEKVPAARYIRLPARASIGEKRNRACKEARGLIIAHWDDDDWYAPARLSRQIAPLLAGEAELSGLENSFTLELASGRFWRTSQSLHRRMFVGDIHGGTLVYWKRLFDEGLRYPPCNIAEDAALIQSATRRGRRLIRVPNDDLFVYVRHGKNAWHFEAGHFLDPAGWELISSPRVFSATDLAELQHAATAS
jgi:glycosyltransferase involved in cell wall biosynthesis